MITKFRDLERPETTIEFMATQSGILIYSVENEMMPMQESIQVELSKENLFDLIGQLLRIQSQLKEGK